MCRFVRAVVPPDLITQQFDGRRPARYRRGGATGWIAGQTAQGPKGGRFTVLVATRVKLPEITGFRGSPRATGSRPVANHPRRRFERWPQEPVSAADDPWGCPARKEAAARRTGPPCAACVLPDARRGWPRGPAPPATDESRKSCTRRSSRPRTPCGTGPSCGRRRPSPPSSGG